ncbi:hypothetical protein BJX66DRAFT_268137 [Aspergillus keveii]|uniref:Uncharacterized protein n=1 Tax=Aspergillus keveii TaxID=714993 RepID=A0ABR4FXF6_9EURO
MTNFGREERPAKSEPWSRGQPDRTFWGQKPELQRSSSLGETDLEDADALTGPQGSIASGGEPHGLRHLSRLSCPVLTVTHRNCAHVVESSTTPRLCLLNCASPSPSRMRQVHSFKLSASRRR